jgi:hypothetical protein
VVTHPDPGDRGGHRRRTNTGAGAGPVAESHRFLGARQISVYTAKSEDVKVYMVRDLTEKERSSR